MISKDKIRSLQDANYRCIKEVQFYQKSDAEVQDLHDEYNKIKLQNEPILKSKLDELAENIYVDVEQRIDNWAENKQVKVKQLFNQDNDFDTTDLILLIGLLAIIDEQTKDYTTTKYLKDVTGAYDSSAKYYTDHELSKISKATGKKVRSVEPPKINFSNPTIQNYYQNYALKAFNGISGKYRDIIEKIIREGYAKKLSIDEIASQIKNAIDPLSKTYKADYIWDRIARTEIAFYTETAKLDSGLNLGISYFQFTTSMDSRVCTICRAYHGRVFNSYEVGSVIIIPVHPLCRCCWIPVWDKDDLNALLFIPFILDDN